MKLLFFIIFTTMFTFANAYSVVGTVENYKGNVKIKSETSVKKNKVKSNLQIKSGDMIVTSQNAFVQIKLNDNSNIVAPATPFGQLVGNPSNRYK